MQRYKRIVLLSALFVVHCSPLSSAFSQDSTSSTPFTAPYAGYNRENITPLRKGVAAGIVGIVGVGMVADAYFTWWKDANKSFSFYTEDWFNGSFRGIDKIGHFYGTYLEFKGMREVMLWGGYSPEASLWWPAGIATFHALEIEIGDAFSPYGFDYQDLTMGLCGVAYGILQTEVPFFNNFNFKVSYWPRGGFTTPANFTSDYDAMTVWLTANVHDLLPSSVCDYWPEWLQVAGGYGVGWGTTRREFVIGLDLNLEGFATNNDHVLLVERVFNNLHYPAPALKLTEGKGPLGYMLHLK